MPRLTDRAARVTTRKHFAACGTRRLLLFASLASTALGLGGCATPGPNHTYVASMGDEPILELAAANPIAKIPCYLFSAKIVDGSAVDPFTD